MKSGAHAYHKHGIKMGLLFIFGYGYVAQVLAQRWIAQGGYVVGTTRSAIKKIQTDRLHVVLEEDLSVWRYLEKSHAVLVTIPPSFSFDQAMKTIHATQFQAQPWMGYLSSTSVYGDHGGAWVDVTSPLRAKTRAGRERIEAEERWRDMEWPSIAFRLGGIYGPNRNMIAKVLAKQPAILPPKERPNHVFSRVHVADIASVLLASIEKGVNAKHASAIMNVVDHYPCASHEIISYLYQKIWHHKPEYIAFENAEMSDEARAFYQDDKKVSQGTLLEDVGVTCQFPTFKEGYGNIGAAF